MSGKDKMYPGRGNEEMINEEFMKKFIYIKIQLSQTPNDLATIRAYASGLMRLGRTKEAIEIFDRALKLDPTDVDTITNKGAAYVMLEKNEEAMKCFDLAIKIDKNSAIAHNNKGRIYAQQGDFEKALKCYNTAIFIDPKFQEACMNRAKILFEQGHFEESIKSFDRLSLKHELGQLFLLNKGETLHHNHRLEEAMKCYDKCMSIKKDTDEYRKCLLEKARILTRIERCREAVPLFEKLINSKNINSEILEKGFLFRGDNFYLMKEYEKAIESYKKSIEMDSTDPKTSEKARNGISKKWTGIEK